MKKSLRFFGTMLLLCTMVLGLFTVPAMAAETKGYRYEAPYGFTYEDFESKKTHVVYYTHNAKDDTYMETFEVIKDVNGSLYVGWTEKLLMKDGIVNRDDCVGFDNAGRFYAITKDGEVRRMKNPTVDTYFETKEIGAKSLVFDEDDLVVGVKTANKTIKINDLSFVREVEVGTGNNVSKDGNYVTINARNDGGIIYKAYYEKKEILTVHCKGSNVWLEQEEILLSDSCVGAKFVGFSTNYEPILLNTDGTMFLFPYKDYKHPFTIVLAEKVLSYNRDDHGFVYSIRTEKATYLVDELFKDKVPDENPNKPGGDDDKPAPKPETMYITYVANTGSSAIAYKGAEVYGILKRDNSRLYWNDTKLDHSKGSIMFGIAANGVPYWVEGNTLYMLDGDEEQYVTSKVTEFKTSSTGNGILESYKAGSSWYIIPIKDVK